MVSVVLRILKSQVCFVSKKAKCVLNHVFVRSIIRMLSVLQMCVLASFVYVCACMCVYVCVREGVGGWVCLCVCVCVCVGVCVYTVFLFYV